MTGPFDLFDLTGRVVLVTGGSRGLGREMVLACAHAGADVVVASRNIESCETVCAQVADETGRATMAYAVHAGRWDELPGLVEAAYERFGRVDVLINNAGKQPVYPNLPEVSEQFFDSVMGINVKGPFRLAVLIGERMVAAGSGSIINVSSTGSIRPNGTIVPYAIAKAGLNAMTTALATAYGPEVRVNTLMPGPFATDATAAWSGNPEAFAGHALRRVGQPNEIVGAALYLASDASSYTTGATIRVDGGIP